VSVRRAGLLAVLALGCQWEVVIGQQTSSLATDAAARDVSSPADAVDDVVALDVPLSHDAAVDAPRDAVVDVPADRDTPIDRPATPEGSITGVALGADVSCVRRTDGRVWCWGANDRGQLGQGDTQPRAAPARVEGLDEVIELAAGSAHVCARRRDRSVWCWGANDRGQLGVGSTTTRLTATRVPGLLADALALGGEHTCALDGSTLSCWGANDRGQLGDGSRMPRVAPMALSGSFTAPAAGRAHTCATQNGSVLCWGANDRGQLGDGSVDERTSPTAVPDTMGHRVLAAGADHVCAQGTDRAVRCWGDGARGALGDGMTTVRTAATAVTSWNMARLMGAGEGFTCVSAAFSDLRCTGRNDRGQLGDMATADRSTPAPLERLTTARADFIALAAGRAHACALITDGTLWCWGDNVRGQIRAGLGEVVRGPERVWQ
jgi:alpha-tubulin suppressor-like RCC1 family protein